ncbi:MAG: hypothetical protein GY868_03235 [Deltaproteobacteria bacterium]|nr:hypothetical protein [Deltaproteobacteria bacterium]
MESKLKQLSGTVDNLQEKINRLESLVSKQAEIIESLSGKTVLPAAALATKVEELESQVQELSDRPVAQTKVVQLPGWLQNTRFGGSLRLRWHHQNRDRADDEDVDRDRFRARVRLYLAKQFRGNIDLGIRMTTDTHTIDDQMAESNLETYLDRFYVRWAPKDWVTLWFGGFGALLSDSELVVHTGNVYTGAVQHLHKQSGNITYNLYLGELMVNERGWSGSVQDDLYLLGAKAGVTVETASWNLTFNVAYFDWSKNITRDPLDDDPSGNYHTNGVRIHDYDVISPYLGIDGKIAGVPVNFYANFANNLATGRKNSAWEVGTVIGRTKNKGDWLFAGFYRLVEANSLVDVFSDYGETNRKGWAAKIEYTILPKWTIEFQTELNEEIFGPRDKMTGYRLQSTIKF